jgi:hypothetical protein
VFQGQLTDGNTTTRILAIEGLARSGPPDFASTIRASLARERTPAVLLAESFASVLLSNGRLDPLFEALVKSSLRDQALRYLIEAAPGRVAAFRPLAPDPEARLREDVADVLGLSRDPAALPIVDSMRTDKDPRVARAAQRAAARLRRLQ